MLGLPISQIYYCSLARIQTETSSFKVNCAIITLQGNKCASNRSRTYIPFPGRVYNPPELPRLDTGILKMWNKWGLNPQPLICKTSALPIELLSHDIFANGIEPLPLPTKQVSVLPIIRCKCCQSGRSRSGGPTAPNGVLYQLSYRLIKNLGWSYDKNPFTLTGITVPKYCGIHRDRTDNFRSDNAACFH